MLTTNVLLSWVNKCDRVSDEEVRRALLEIIGRREGGAEGEEDASVEDKTGQGL